MIRKGIKSISIKNRTIKSKQKLLEWIDSLHPTNNLNENPNIIINCTPLGMWPKINSMPDIEINNQSTLIETVYNPLETKWLKYGKEIGAKTISGLDMFIWFANSITFFSICIFTSMRGATFKAPSVIKRGLSSSDNVICQI